MFLSFKLLLFYVFLVSYILFFSCLIFIFIYCMLVHISGLPAVWYHLSNDNVSKYWSMACSYWFVWSSQIYCYHLKEDFEIFKSESSTILLFFYSTIICLLLVQHSNIEINPGPWKQQPKYFSCHFSFYFSLECQQCTSS